MIARRLAKIYENKLIYSENDSRRKKTIVNISHILLLALWTPSHGNYIKLWKICELKGESEEKWKNYCKCCNHPESGLNPFWS